MKELYYDGELIYTHDIKGKIGDWLQEWRDYFSSEEGLFQIYMGMIGHSPNIEYVPELMTARENSWDNRDRSTIIEEANYVCL